jgi:hypothetical protein
MINYVWNDFQSENFSQVNKIGKEESKERYKILKNLEIFGQTKSVWD